MVGVASIGLTSAVYAVTSDNSQEVLEEQHHILQVNA